MFYFSFDGSIIANEYEQSMNKTLTYCEKHTKMICKPEKYYKIYTKTKNEKEIKCAERFYGNIKPGFLPQAVDHFFVSFFAGILYAF